MIKDGTGMRRFHTVIIDELNHISDSTWKEMGQRIDRDFKEVQDENEMSRRIRGEFYTELHHNREEYSNWRDGITREQWMSMRVKPYKEITNVKVSDVPKDQALVPVDVQAKRNPSGRAPFGSWTRGLRRLLRY